MRNESEAKELLCSVNGLDGLMGIIEESIETTFIEWIENEVKVDEF